MKASDFEKGLEKTYNEQVKTTPQEECNHEKGYCRLNVIKCQSCLAGFSPEDVLANCTCDTQEKFQEPKALPDTHPSVSNLPNTHPAPQEERRSDGNGTIGITVPIVEEWEVDFAQKIVQNSFTIEDLSNKDRVMLQKLINIRLNGTAEEWRTSDIISVALSYTAYKVKDLLSTLESKE